MKKLICFIIVSFFWTLECKASVVNSYYKTYCFNNSCNTYEISEEEYESISPIQLLGSNIETEYKRLSLSTAGNMAEIKVEWKKTPKYKSFDVIAIVGSGVAFDNSKVSGYQHAILDNNNNPSVKYSLSSKNTKILDNGIGISMNLIDGGIYYELSLSIIYNGHGTIYGNYRHATSNVTLNQSLGYEVTNGNIVFSNNSIDSKYDRVKPLTINV